MPFTTIETGKLADAAAHQIELLILRGVLRPGERLPAERDLSERMSVSRPSVREALAQLEAAGLLVLKPGSGAFVADVLGTAFAPPLIELFSKHSEALDDYLAFRRDLEGLAAERAARHATDKDLEVVAAVFAKMETAHQKRSSREEAQLDADFHMSIVEAAHNVIMLHMMRSIFEMLRKGVFYNRQVLFAQRTTRNELLEQHRAVHDALMARDPVGARAAVEAHLSFIETAMIAARRTESLTKTAGQRLSRVKAE